jgi:hypothetical protein
LQQFLLAYTCATPSNLALRLSYSCMFSITTSIEARTASGDCIGRAFEMMALALLSKTLGADTAHHLFPAPASPAVRGENL